VFEAYLDESGNHDDRLLVVAGYVSDVNKWAELSIHWTSLLKKYNLRCFHMKEFVNGRSRAFRHLSRRDKSDLLTALVELIKGAAAFGTAALIRPREYNQLTSEDFRAYHGTSYSFAVQACLALTNVRLIDSDNASATLGVFLEEGHPNAAQVIADIQELKTQTDTLVVDSDAVLVRDEYAPIAPFKDSLGRADRLRERGVKIAAYGLGSKNTMPALQAADIFAYSLYALMRQSKNASFGEEVLGTLSDRVPHYTIPCNADRISQLVQGTVTAQEELRKTKRATTALVKELKQEGFTVKVMPHQGLDIFGDRRKLAEFLARRKDKFQDPDTD
jgi:Protein of unknown function (DUF3800)